jgi:flagellin
MSDITLSRGVRSNLLNLQRTADAISMTQNKLATGKRVNSALDNPSNFFTASSLTSRAADLGNLLDSMSGGIKTLEAADNGLKAITKTVESMQSTIRQARQDASWKSASATVTQAGLTDRLGATKNLSFTGGSVGSTAVNINTVATAAANGVKTGSADVAGTYTGGTLSVNGTNLTVANDLNAAGLAALVNGNSTLQAAGVTATDDAGTLVITSTSGNVDLTGSTASVLTGTNLTATATTNFAQGALKTVDALVTEINGNSSLTGKVRASNDNGKLKIDNLSTEALTVGGMASGGFTGEASSTTSIGGNDTRKNLISQFNELRTQLDKLADDAAYNGVNLLRGDKLKLNFNEAGTSSIEIQAKDANGTVRGINTGANSLDLGVGTAAEFASDASLDTRLDKLSASLGTLRSQSSAFGSNLSIVQNRTDFTKSMMNTLRTGADGLTLADMNEEAANLLSLQTRQQLSSTALGLANQADQGVLRLF